MYTIKELVTLLQTLPDDVKCADVDTDEDGDLKLEWYYGVRNLVILTVPTDGCRPYITYLFADYGNTEHDLSKLPYLIEKAKE